MLCVGIQKHSELTLAQYTIKTKIDRGGAGDKDECKVLPNPAI